MKKVAPCLATLGRLQGSDRHRRGRGLWFM